MQYLCCYVYNEKMVAILNFSVYLFTSYGYILVPLKCWNINANGLAWWMSLQISISEVISCLEGGSLKLMRYVEARREDVQGHNEAWKIWGVHLRGVSVALYSITFQF